MLPRADLASARPPASVDATATTASATDARQEVYRRLATIALGRELQATVLSRRDDGTYLVKIADTAAGMALPKGTRVGDTLTMTFIARSPRPTFLLAQPNGSTPTSISSTARLIDHLRQAGGKDGERMTIGAAKALLSGFSKDPGQIAAALKHGLASSGLFYESHLQEWISGGRALSELKAEPQAAFALRGDADTVTAHAASSDPSIPSKGTGPEASAPGLPGAIANAGAHTDVDVVSTGRPSFPEIGTEAARLINVQLQTLEQQRVCWQGELWPGQALEWDVAEEGQASDQEERAEPVWNSSMRFQLPHLGEIAANIRLVGQRVHVQIETTSATTASSLRASSGMLADALEAAGSPLDSFLVKRDETA